MTWAPLVPFAKARAGLDEGALGLLLFCVGGGAILAMPPAGALAARFGCRRVLIASAALVCATLPVLATASSVPLLAAALVAFGAGAGGFDCVVNLQAIIVERASGRALMSGFHGLYSLGGMVGAAGVSALLGAGSLPLGATLSMDAGIVLALAVAARNFLSYGSQAQGPAFALPRGAVLLIGILCLILFLTEGAVLDWSAVFLTAVRGVSPSRAGLGYAAFALAMTVGRFAGDRIVGRVGGANVITFGGLCAAGGLAVATLVPSWEAGMVGYFLVGAAARTSFPSSTAQSDARRQPWNMSPSPRPRPSAMSASWAARRRSASSPGPRICRAPFLQWHCCCLVSPQPGAGCSASPSPPQRRRSRGLRRDPPFSALRR
ncbi:MAG: MFS transporter [Methylobacteriaceae bacterium]|nr:MFS transporter [Methylobacteriaceae bacterium]